VTDLPLVNQRHSTLCAADGSALHITDYLLPLVQARGSIVLMHGLGEHSGRYRHVAEFLTSCGLSVRTYDHRGHGRSEGRRGDVINSQTLVQDAQIVVEDFAAQFTAPPFLLGHSMGGLFACHFALTRRAPLRGLILSSPALSVRLSRFDQVMLRMLERVAPSLGVPNGVRPEKLSRRPEVGAAYRADPLVHNKISARLLRSMLDAIAFCGEQAPALAVPTLLVVAGDDQLVDPGGSLAFGARAPKELAHLHVYPGFYHEVFNEIEPERPFADVRAWLETRI
jgi:alpha-beta hydrolase superfamily lysophospholipase